MTAKTTILLLAGLVALASACDHEAELPEFSEAPDVDEAEPLGGSGYDEPEPEPVSCIGATPLSFCRLAVIFTAYAGPGSREARALLGITEGLGIGEDVFFRGVYSQTPSLDECLGREATESERRCDVDTAACDSDTCLSVEGLRECRPAASEKWGCSPGVDKYAEQYEACVELALDAADGESDRYVIQICDMLMPTSGE